jgi:hypothetical protein
MDGWADGRTNGRKDWWTVGWMDGRMDDWIDTERRMSNLILCSDYSIRNIREVNLCTGGQLNLVRRAPASSACSRSYKVKYRFVILLIRGPIRANNYVRNHIADVRGGKVVPVLN